MPHLVATLIYLSQNYSYHIRGDRSPLINMCVAQHYLNPPRWPILKPLSRHHQAIINAGLILGHRLQIWPIIKQTLITKPLSVFPEFCSPSNVGPPLALVADDGPTVEVHIRRIFPANTRHSSNVVSMLGQRRRMPRVCWVMMFATCVVPVYCCLVVQLRFGSPYR